MAENRQLSRQSEKYSGGVVAPIFVLAALLCLFFSEREVARAHVMMKVGTQAVVSIDPAELSPEHRGRLVHFSGLVQTDEVLTDPLLEISAEGLVLRREAEMYQWQEQEHRETGTDSQGRQTTSVSYSYDRGWESYAVQSARFSQPQGHENSGSMPVQSATFVTQDARLGGIALPAALLEQIEYRLPVSAATAKTLPLDLAPEPGEAYFHYRSNPRSTSVGDVRVSFSIVPETYVSVVARLEGDTVVPYPVADDVEIFMIEDDLIPAELMLSRAQQKVTEQKWIYRVVGFLLLFFGLLFFWGWIKSIAGRIPIIAALRRTNDLLSVALLSLMLTGVVLSSAWLLYDARIGILVLLPSVALGMTCHRLGGRKAA